MKSSNISVVILFYRTPEKVITRLKNYKGFDIYILGQSNDLELKKKLKKNYQKLSIMVCLARTKVLQKE